jgi:hypothetical protein
MLRLRSFSSRRFSKSPFRCGYKFSSRHAKSLNRRRDPRPFFSKEFLPFAFEQKFARAGFNEHPEPASHLDQIFINELLISLQHRQRIDPIFRRDVADRRQGIAFLEHTVENHMNATIAQLAINRLMFIPLAIHSLNHVVPGRRPSPQLRLIQRSSYTVIVKYNSIADASFFLRKIFAR